MAEIENKKLEFSFLPEVAPLARGYVSSREVNASVPNNEEIIIIPGNAEEITPGNANTSKGRTICKISKGNTFTGSITFPDKQKNQLYIEGTWRPSGESRLPNNSEIFILDGGTILPTDDWRLNLTSSSITICAGGQIGKEGNTDTEISLDNNCTVSNSGLVYMGDFVLTGGNGSKIENYGEMHMEDLASKTSGIKFDNNGILHGKELNINNNTKFTNQCIATFEDIKLKSTILEIAGYSSMTCETLFMLGATIDLHNNAILKVTEETILDNATKNTFHGKGTGNGNDATSLLLMNTIEWKNTYKKHNTEFKGDLQLYCQSLLGSKNQYKFLGKATQTSTPTIEIKQYTCSIGNKPDEGGYPVDPSFPLPDVNECNYTWVSEDNYPSAQYDYDINDIVMGIESITYYIANDNSITSMDINLQLRAVGGTKHLGAALQLQGIHDCYAIIDRNLFEYAKNASIEKDESGDVIPLFDNALTAMGVTERVNVHPDGVKTNPVNFTVHVEFSKAVSSNDINISTFNFFVIVGKSFKKKRMEVHVSGIGNFRHTSRSITPLQVQTDLSNLFWGLLIPGRFEYPIESTDIKIAYPNFSKWVSSGGSDYLDWYKTEKKEEAIYKEK